MTMAVIRSLLLAALLGVCLGKVSYDGYKVLKVTPKDDVQLRSVIDMKRILSDTVDFWREPKYSGDSADIMVGPNTMDSVRKMLSRYGLESSVMIDDVQKLSDKITIGQEGGIASLSNFNYDVYHTVPEIEQWVQDMANTHSDLVSQYNIGSSYEGQALRVMKLGKPGSGKPIFWWHTGTHSREWLAPATLMKIVDMLVTKYKAGDAEIVTLLDKVDFYIMPMLNPDGYKYSYQYDRMWRKTKTPNPGYWCLGTDPNRNWDDHWDHYASDSYPCSQSYRGPSAFSEIEVLTVANYIKGLSNVEVFIDMHTYTQLWMVPYGWTKSLPPNYNDQMTVANDAMAALKKVNGLTFRTGSIANLLYLAPGSSIDWAYGQAGIQHAFAPELRDTGYYGFLMPEQYISDSANEVFEAIKVTGQHIMSH